VHARSMTHWALRAECEESGALKPTYNGIHMWEMMSGRVRLMMHKPKAVLKSQV